MSLSRDVRMTEEAFLAAKYEFLRMIVGRQAADEMTGRGMTRDFTWAAKKMAEGSLVQQAARSGEKDATLAVQGFAEERAMIVREAVPGDMAALLQAAEEFTRFSGWRWEFDREAANARFWLHMHHEGSAVLVVEDDGALLAGAILHTDRDFTVETLGYIVKFCVTRAGRRTEAPRLLAGACVAWFRERGCAAVFGTSTARLPLATKSYANLLARHGFTDCGPTLALEMQL